VTRVALAALAALALSGCGRSLTAPQIEQDGPVAGMTYAWAGDTWVEAPAGFYRFDGVEMIGDRGNVGHGGLTE
jgi:hypothetical protein